MLNHFAKIFFVACTLLFALNIKAQTNLVPNPSFENHTACPTTLGDFKATNWWVSSQTPDYHNACANTYTNGCTGVPYNAYGYQQAFQGNAYCGLFTIDYTGSSSTANYREYISTQLSSTLVVGTKYYFSLQIACTLTYDTSYSLPCTQGINGATNKMGALFTTNKYDATHNLPIRNFAHFFESNIISDTANWIQLKGSFIADSAYQYINLGNFFDDNHTDTVHIWHDAQAGNPIALLAYNYIDDVIVTTDSTLLSIKQNNNNEDLVIFPNPIADNFFYIKSILTTQTINVFNQLGEQIKFKLYNEPNNLLKVVFDKEIEKGIYYLEITTQNKTSHYSIIKN
jgi:hypothetical protein